MEKTRAAVAVQGTTRLALVMAVLVTALMVAVPSVQAITTILDTEFCSTDCGPGPFGAVAVEQLNGDVEVVAALAPGYQFVKTGALDQQAFAFNANGITSADISGITNTNPPLQTLVANTGSFGGGGVGNFAFGIECPSCGSGAPGAFPGPLVFTVANATVSDFLVPNNNGFFFAADIIQLSTGATGVVTSSGVVVTPEPTSIVLVGIGLCGISLGAALRRKKA